MLWSDAFGAVGAGAGAAAVTLLLAAGLVALVFYVFCARHAPSLSTVPRQRVDTVTDWRTGDIILTQHMDYAGVLALMPPLSNLPMHAGVVWVHPQYGPVVVDTFNSWRRRGDLPDVRTGAFVSTGTRVVRALDYVNGYGGPVFRRALIRGTLDEAAFAEAVDYWAADLPFDSLVSSRQPLVLAGIGLASIWPSASTALISLGDPARALRAASTPASAASTPFKPKPTDLAKAKAEQEAQREGGIYCSELVMALLQRAGALDPAFPTHPTSPFSLTSSIGTLDAAGAARGFAWGPEVQLIRSTG